MKRQREKVRLNNLEILIAEAGSATKVAKLAGTSESYLSQVRRKMLTQSGTPRGLGNELAAKLEKGLGKYTGWMDEPHEAEYEASSTHRRVRVGNRIAYTGGETAAVKLPVQDLSLKEHEPADAYARKPGSSSTNEEAGADIITLCPLVSWAQACKVGTSKAFEQRNAEEILPCPIRCSQGTFILRVKGASMEPRFYNGDLIFVDPEVAAESGKYVIVKLEDSDEATFKQLIVEGGRKYLKALNPDWPERIVELNGSAVICGAVVFKGERL